MDNEKLKILIDDYIQEIKGLQWVNCRTDIGYRYLDILNNAKKLLTDNSIYLENLISNYKSRSEAHDGYMQDSNYSLNQSKVVTSLKYTLKLLSVNFPEIIEKKKILEDAQDKLTEAGISFENQDFSSVITKLNTGVELALKDELDIPMTIRRINTRKILDICIASNIGPKEYLKELIKHVVDVDNKIKHQGFRPQKVDAINAISAFEGFIQRVKKYPFKVTDEIKEKIFSGI